MLPSQFAATPEPPYYAVIFSSQTTDIKSGYPATAERMLQLAAQQLGFLGVETTRDALGFGITVSYWSSLAAISQWKAVSEHVSAQVAGRISWYAQYAVRICKVERAYGFDAL
jgi:heme-degrading monooxygenase HmoA